MAFFKIPLVLTVTLLCTCEVKLQQTPTRKCNVHVDGIFERDAGNCAVAYSCDGARGTWKTITCPESYYFDLNTNNCNKDYLVTCSKVCESNPCLYNGMCREVKGGYECSYPKTHRKPVVEPKLLVTEYGTRSVFIINPLTDKAVKLPLSHLGNPNTAIFDSSSQTLYLAAEYPNQIMSCNLKGDNIRILTDASSEGIALDTKEKLLFYTDYRQKTVNVVSTRGEQRKTIVSTDVRHPRSLVLDTASRHVIWIDIFMRTIERCGYDGSRREILVSHQLARPQSLTIDTSGQKLFWCDNGDAIHECALNGDKTRVLLHSSDLAASQCESIVWNNNKLYTVYMLTNRISVWEMSGKLAGKLSAHGVLQNGRYKSVEVMY